MGSEMCIRDRLRGGHGIEIDESCKFIETKQGPYLPDLDKKRF